MLIKVYLRKHLEIAIRLSTKMTISGSYSILWDLFEFETKFLKKEGVSEKGYWKICDFYIFCFEEQERGVGEWIKKFWFSIFVKTRIR